MDLTPLLTVWALPANRLKSLEVHQQYLICLIRKNKKSYILPHHKSQDPCDTASEFMSLQFVTVCGASADSTQGVVAIIGHGLGIVEGLLLDLLFEPLKTSWDEGIGIGLWQVKKW